MGSGAGEHAQCNGVALVLTLAFLLLLSAVVLAFFSQAATTRQISFSSVGQARAEQIASTAVWNLTADLIDEMRAGSKNASARPGGFFEPLGSDFRRPQRSQVNPGIRNLIKGSFPGEPFWQAGSAEPGAPAYHFDGPLRVYEEDENSTSEPSINGRFVRPSRWGLPRLHDHDPQLESGFTAPGWIYVSRAGPIEVVPGESLNFTAWSNSDPENEEYVLGRYAFLVYDVGGLLDINLAGARAGLLSEGKAARGSHLAFADLAVLQPNNEVLDVATLVDWRHAGSIEAGQYGELYERPDWDFRRPWPGDQMFLTRQDLLAAVDEQSGLRGPGGTALSREHLHKLTIFSRTKNAPYRQPSGIDRAGDPAPVDDSFNPHPLAIRVTTEFTRRDGTTARVGEPLIRSRFPLSKLGLLDGIDSRAGALTGDAETLADIRDYFGLIQAGDEYSWRYDPEFTVVDSDGRRLMTLQEVRDQGREPNFFEMLQAAILHGSLGSAAHDSGSGEEGTVFMTQAYDERPVYQILQIGANIIDQYDADDFPTSIRFPASDAAEEDIQIFGRENLPYVYSIGVAVMRPGREQVEWQNAGYDYVGGWFQFALWNPTQSAVHPTEHRLRVGSSDGVARVELESFDETLHPGTYTGADPFEARSTDMFPAAVASRDFGSNPGYLEFTNDSLFSELTFLDFPRLNTPEAPTAPGSDPSNHVHRSGEGETAPVGHMELPVLAGLFVANAEASEPWLQLQPEGKREFDLYHDFVEMFEQNTLNQLEAAMAEADQAVQGAEPGTPEYHDAVAAREDLELLHEDTVQELSQLMEPFERNHPRYHYFPLGWLANRVEKMISESGGVLEHDPNLPRIPEVPNARFRHGYLVPDPANPPVFELEIYDPGFGDYRPYQRLEHLIAGTAEIRHYLPSPWYMLRLHGHGGSFFGHQGYVSFDPRSMRYGMVGFSNFRQMLRARTEPYEIPDTLVSKGRTPASGGGPPGNYFPHDRGLDPLPTGAGWQTLNRFWPAALTDNTDQATWVPHPSHNPQPRNTFVRDPDGVLRRAMGTHGEGASPHTGGADNRPARLVILNRPFESVGDMAYAFRDQPWKDLDFCRRESADLALLDYFSIEEGDIVAGRIDLNTPHTDLLASLLSGGGFSELDSAKTISQNLAEQVATELGAAGPFHGLDEVVQFLDGRNFMPDPPYQTEYEAIIRRLSGTSQVRTWNVMVDVIAQSGRFPPDTSNFNSFAVEGETRSWIHLAIDRYTGEVVDYVYERVLE